MTKYITEAIFNGTKTRLAISGNSIDGIMLKVRKDRTVRNASLFLFYSRKTNELVDARFN